MAVVWMVRLTMAHRAVVVVTLVVMAGLVVAILVAELVAELVIAMGMTASRPIRRTAAGLTRPMTAKHKPKTHQPSPVAIQPAAPRCWHWPRSRPGGGTVPGRRLARLERPPRSGVYG